MADLLSSSTLQGFCAATALAIAFVVYKLRRDRELFDATAEHRAAVDFALEIAPLTEGQLSTKYSNARGVYFLELWRSGCHTEVERHWPDWPAFRRSYLLEAE